MGKIVVYHPYFGQGGAESVCMHVLEALQTEHNLTLLSMSDIDIAEQNEYFDTEVSTSVETTQCGAIGKVLELDMDMLDQILGRNFGRIHAAVFNRVVKNQSEFDLIFSSHGELVTDLPSIQYIHYPWYNRSELPETLETRSTSENLYNRLCHALAAHDDDEIRNQRLLTNSNWTANILQKLYGVRPETVYPPLVTRDFEPRPWNERDNGFVCVGRLSPEKNIHRNINIVEQLREQGHDVHLHVIGPTPKEAYGRRIKQLAVERPYVYLEGRISRDRLIELICTHRYGIHGMEYEHFGIAVAELVAGGTIPFVPNSGGQQEIVDQLDGVTYNSVVDAVEKADVILSDPDTQRSIKSSLADVEERFGPERFKRDIRNIVTEVLNDR